MKVVRAHVDGTREFREPYFFCCILDISTDLGDLCSMLLLQGWCIRKASLAGTEPCRLRR
jgi:hypothetical protein